MRLRGMLKLKVSPGQESLFNHRIEASQVLMSRAADKRLPSYLL